jgi:hypothetical protein
MARHSGVVGEVDQDVAQLLVAGRPEPDRAGLARGAGDWGDAAKGGQGVVVGEAGADVADLGQQPGGTHAVASLGQVDKTRRSWRPGPSVAADLMLVLLRQATHAVDQRAPRLQTGTSRNSSLPDQPDEEGVPLSYTARVHGRPCGRRTPQRHPIRRLAKFPGSYRSRGTSSATTSTLMGASSADVQDEVESSGAEGG